MLPSAAAEVSRVSIRPGVSVLSVLQHLNYKPWFALAEFVDNAVQSFHDSRQELTAIGGEHWKLRVTVEVDTSAPGRITVRDNAAGICLRDFPRAFRPAVIPPDRSGLSEFGMGMKSAACWFASQWQVRTKAIGEPVERVVRFDIDRIVRDDIEELEIEERPASLSDHYTEITLDALHHVPQGRSLGKIKEHLTDIYRVLIRAGELELRFGNDILAYDEPPVLTAPYYKDPSGEVVAWRKDINFELGGGLAVHGFAALRDPGNYSRSGFALFRRGRLIEGSGEEGYRPPLIFGTSGSSSYARLRLFGELHLDGFEVSHTKDGFRWDENEEPFLELLKEHLDEEPVALLRQCENYRSLATRKERAQAATTALARATEAVEEKLAETIQSVAEKPPVETVTAPLAPQPTLASRDLRLSFRGERWLVRIELSDDPGEGEWLSLSDIGSNGGQENVTQIRIAMKHPFMVSFAQTNAHEIEPLLRVGAALAIAEKLARRAGVKSAGTVRRNMNDIIREALSER